MCFMMNPQEIPHDATWTGKYFHLTYAGFIDKDIFLEMVRGATTVPLIGWSICHEDTTRVVGNTTYTGHQHTHGAIMFKSKIKLRGARVFDVVVVPADPTQSPIVFHPNVQPKVTISQMEQIFTNYHQGRKYDITQGKMVYKEPVWFEQKLPPMFEFTRAMIDEIVQAPTLIEACMAGAVRPRTVNDVVKLREETAAHAAKKFNHKFPKDSFTLQFPDAHVIHLYGPSGFGKTKAALAQFENPCMVKPFDSIGCLEALSRSFDPNLHDGLVLDEADLSFMSRQQVIAFVDPDEDCTLDVRFKSFTLPATLKKIIVSNDHPTKCYPPDPFGAIARRIQVLPVTAKTYRGPTAPLPPPPLLQPPRPPPPPARMATGMEHARNAAANAALSAFGAFGTQ